MVDIEIKSDDISYEEIQNLLNLSHRDNEKKGLKYSTQNQSVNKLIEKIGTGDCIVAKIDGKLVGTVTVDYRKLNYWYCREFCAIIKLLGVHPEYKGNKIGTALVNKCIELAKLKKCNIVVADSAEKNYSLMNLCYKFDFKKVDFCKYKNNNFYSAVYAKWIDNNYPNKVKCFFKYNLKKIYIMFRYKRNTGK